MDKEIETGNGLSLGKCADSTNYSSIPKQAIIGEKYALSLQQQSLWLLQQLDPADYSYNESKVLRIKGPLDPVKLNQAVLDLVHRHQILRTVYVSSEGEPLQFILPDPDAKLNILNAIGDDNNPRTAVEASIKERAIQSFDLRSDIPFRADLYVIEPEEHLLHLTMHHIATDGLTWPILLEDLFNIYTAKLAGEPHAQALAPDMLAIQYADYSVWQREVETDAGFQPALEYWIKKLDGATDLNLPTDNIQQITKSHRGRAHSFTLPSDLVDNCKRLARLHRATPFVVLFSAFNLLLARMTGKSDVVVGLPVSVRTEEQLESIPGMFVNTIAVRSALSKEASFSDLITTTRDNWLESLEHQKLPFDKLVAALSPDRDSNRNPVFQAFFSYLPQSAYRLSVPGLSIEPVEIDFRTSRFDVELSLQATAVNIEGRLFYDSDLFEPSSIARMASLYLTVLEEMTTNVDALIWRVPLLKGKERRIVLQQWNETKAPIPRQPVHELFERQARETPARLAIRHGEKQLNYSELNSLANRIAARLKQMGVTTETAVALNLERSVEYIAACLAVMKAGGVFVPVDTILPATRQAYILDNSGAKVMISYGTVPGLVLPKALQVLDLEAHSEILQDEPANDQPIGVDLKSAVYILYTSGSTGEPNGVVGTQLGLVNRLHWMQTRYPFQPNDFCAARTNIGFVDSVTEILGPLLFGATVVVIDNPDVSDAREFVSILEREDITRVVLVPSFLRVLLEIADNIDEMLPDLRFWVCSGEQLSQDLALRFRQQLPNRTLLNLFGSTELSGDALAEEVVKGQVTTIGRPIANTTCYILNAQFEPVPIGVPGQLCVGGDGLAREYLGRPDLTQERFILAPFDNQNQIRLFQTGDVARFLSDGRIEYLGRNDMQVKLRGMRIEIGEVEAALRTIKEVLDAIVIPLPDASAASQLTGYIRTQSLKHRPNFIQEVRAKLERILPAHFIPAQIIEIDEFPKTPSGKIDRRACRDMNLRITEAEPEVELTGDSHVLESRLRDVWRQVLDDCSIGTKANFFELGGHSLLAVRLVAQIEITFGIRLPLKALFEAPTVQLLAKQMLKRPDRFAAFQMESSLYHRDSPPLFLLRGLFHYRGLAKALKDIVPTYAIFMEDEACGGAGTETNQSQHSLQQLAQRYVEQIRNVYPTGPYYLAGLSAGGVLALEVARQLKVSGHEISLVALLDTNAPRRPVQMWFANMREWIRCQVLGRPPKASETSVITNLYKDAYRLFGQAPFRGDVVFFRAEDRSFFSLAPDISWKRYINGEITLHEVPGNHLSMMQGSNVVALGSAIARYLPSQRYGGEASSEENH
jgi:amino acid adenylation domain-containing protein